MARPRTAVNLVVGCTWDGNGSAGVLYNVALSTGSGGSGYLPRRLSFGGYKLNYNIYTAANYTTVWGNGAGGAQTIAGSAWTLKNANQQETRSHTLYGRIAPNQKTARVGSYSDVITITLSY